MIPIDQLPEGMQFRTARVAYGLTLFQVGSRANIAPQRLSEFELGRPGLSEEAVERAWDVLNAHAQADITAPQARCSVRSRDRGCGSSANHNTAA